jgi:hypothetical protein
MNDLLMTRVASLEAWSETQERRARRSFLWSAVAYGVLVLIVLAYTLIILPILKGLTTPTVLGEQAHAWLLTEVPAQRRALIGYCMDNSPVWSQAGVELVKSAVPALEEHIKAVLETYTSKLADSVKSDLGPALTKAVTARTPELKAKYEELKKTNKGQEVAGTLAALLSQEMDTYLTNDFIVATEKLQNQLRDLATRPESQLTRREEAQRRALSAWTVLSEQGDMGQGMLNELTGKANELFVKYFSKEKKAAPAADAGPGAGVNPPAGAGAEKPAVAP